MHKFPKKYPVKRPPPLRLLASSTQIEAGAANISSRIIHFYAVNSLQPSPLYGDNNRRRMDTFCMQVVRLLDCSSLSRVIFFRHPFWKKKKARKGLSLFADVIELLSRNGYKFGETSVQFHIVLLIFIPMISETALPRITDSDMNSDSINFPSRATLLLTLTSSPESVFSLNKTIFEFPQWRPSDECPTVITT